MASAAINYLPNFAFYTRNQVLTPSSDEVKTLDFEEAFQHHLMEPTTFDDAYNHEDPEQRAKWHEAISKEFWDMTNHGVWCKVQCSVIPKGHRCIKSKWVFKIKHAVCFGPVWLHAATVRFLVLTSPRIMPQWWMMSLGISCWSQW